MLLLLIVTVVSLTMNVFVGIEVSDVVPVDVTPVFSPLLMISDVSVFYVEMVEAVPANTQ